MAGRITFRPLSEYPNPLSCPNPLCGSPPPLLAGLSHLGFRPTTALEETLLPRPTLSTTQSVSSSSFPSCPWVDLNSTLLLAAIIKASWFWNLGPTLYIWPSIVLIQYWYMQWPQSIFAAVFCCWYLIKWLTPASTLASILSFWLTPLPRLNLGRGVEGLVLPGIRSIRSAVTVCAQSVKKTGWLPTLRPVLAVWLPLPPTPQNTQHRQYV